MPDFVLELQNGRGTGKLIAGVDEVGRGPLAGPVVAAAVIWPDALAEHEFYALIRDSKMMTPRQRERMDTFIRAESCWAIAESTVAEIDSMNILQASLQAMHRAVTALAQAPVHLLLDGNQKIRQCTLPQTCVIGGDSKSLSIAAAAIIAKVARDALMAQLDAEFPGYGWASNAGYSSAGHMAALRKLGPTPHHRTSFAPVRDLIQAA